MGWLEPRSNKRLRQRVVRKKYRIRHPHHDFVSRVFLAIHHGKKMWWPAPKKKTKHVRADLESQSIVYFEIFSDFLFNMYHWFGFCKINNCLLLVGWKVEPNMGSIWNWHAACCLNKFQLTWLIFYETTRCTQKMVWKRLELWVGVPYPLRWQTARDFDSINLMPKTNATLISNELDVRHLWLDVNAIGCAELLMIYQCK